MTVLVSGAAGFIGSAVANALHRNGLEILAVDNFTDYYARDLKELRVQELLESNSIEFKHCDLSSDILVRELFESNKISKVFHLAAQPGVRISSQQAERYTHKRDVAFTCADFTCLSQLTDYAPKADVASGMGVDRADSLKYEWMDRLGQGIDI